MDRVFFEDNTFEAVCPECGSSEWLYRKNNAISKKGHFVTFKPDGWTWGTNELKHFGIVRIDCTEAQAYEWCEGIHNERAEADTERYTKLADAQRQIVVERVKRDMSAPTSEEELNALKAAIKEALETDVLYSAYRGGEHQAMNRAIIDERPRKFAFEFEKTLSAKELLSWNSMDEDSVIIEQNTGTINMKAID
jgi:hypothetical protein